MLATGVRKVMLAPETQLKPPVHRDITQIGQQQHVLHVRSEAIAPTPLRAFHQLVRVATTARLLDCPRNCLVQQELPLPRVPAPVRLAARASTVR